MVTTVVLTAGVAVVTSTPPELPTTTPGMVSGVEVVVVVVTERTGAGGGGAETTCDSGWVAQPASRPSAPHVINTVVSRATAETGVELGRAVILFVGMFFVFIFREYVRIPPGTMGSCTKPERFSSTTDGHG
jgi:hypothetical protein